MNRGDVQRIWERTGYLFKPENDRSLMSAIGAIGTHAVGQRFAWRGMSSADYKFSSSLHRLLGEEASEAHVRAAEDSMITSAHEWGLGVTRLGVVDDLQLLADLQHYGVSTRLIDVTSDPMTALWFACQRPSTPGVIMNGLIVAVNITSLRQTVALTRSDGTWGTAGAYHATSRLDSLAGSAPFTIQAAEANPRLASQAGYFITGAVPISRTEVFPSIDIRFVSRRMPLDLLAPRTVGQPEKLPFVAIVVPSQMKSKLLTHLDGTYNKSARTLFPDFSGFREFGVPSGSHEPSRVHQ